MKLDETIIPDPFNPRSLDAYGSPDAKPRHELVVSRVSWDPVVSAEVVHYFLAGVPGQAATRDFPALVASLELTPTGRIVVATEEP